jgi:hypothetical protein
LTTKLYLHRTEITSPGTLPSGEQSSLTADANLFDNEDGTENRLMDKSISTAAQTSLTNTSTGDTSSHNYYIARWVSPQLNQTSVAANTWTVEFAASESNAAANFPVTTSAAARPVCYVWKPSNGTKYGNIIDGAGGTVSESGTTQTVLTYTFSGSAVSSLTAGDAVIVFELWAIVTQGNTTQRTQTVFYDGTTENSTSNEAAFISTPENLLFAYTRAPATESTSISETLARSEGFNRAIVTETVSSSETLARMRALTRYIGGSSLDFDGSNDYLNCGDQSGLWSQSLTKFSFAFWIYPTAGWDGNFRIVADHNGGANQSFQCFIHNANANQIGFQLWNNVGTQFISRNNSLTLNAWNHITCVYDNSLGSANVKIYVNTTVGGITADLTQSINQTGILALAFDTTDFKGQMKDFRWYTTKALTQTEINNIYTNSSSAPTPDYWLKMDEMQQTPVDSIGNKSTTLSGPIWSTLSPSVWPNENYTISDSIVRSAGRIRTLETETVSISDTLTRVYGAVRTIATEVISIVDSVVRQTGVGNVNLVRAITEDTAISESISRMLAASRAISENTSSSEILARMIAVIRAIGTESVSISDSIASSIGRVRSIIENMDVSDSVVRMLAATRNPVENTAVSETIARLQTLFRTITETVISNEILSRLLAASRVMATEVTSITDSIARTLAKNYTAAMTETVTITSSVVRMLGANRALTENVVSAETLTRLQTLFRTISESTIITDAISRGFVYTRSIVTEVIIISDSVTRSAGRVRTLTETVNVSESLSRLLVSIRALTESVVQSDSLVVQKALSRLVTEITPVSDSIVRSVGRVRTLIENISIDDSINRLYDGVRTIIETTDITDSLTKLITRLSIPTRLHNLKQYIIAKYSISDPSL